MATKKMIVAPKQGDYFKAKIGGTHVTGRVTAQSDADGEGKVYQYALVFDNDDTDKGFEARTLSNCYGFSNNAEVSDTTDFEVITRAEHLKLAKSLLYKGFKGYTIHFKKASKAENDIFSFGCGAIEVTRKDVEQLLAVFSKVKPSQLESIVSLLKEIEDETGDSIKDEELPAIKELLTIK